MFTITLKCFSIFLFLFWNKHFFYPQNIFIRRFYLHLFLKTKIFLPAYLFFSRQIFKFKINKLIELDEEVFFCLLLYNSIQLIWNSFPITIYFYLTSIYQFSGTKRVAIIGIFLIYLFFSSISLRILLF